MEKDNKQKKADVLMHLGLAMSAITKDIPEIERDEIMEAIKALNEID